MLSPPTQGVDVLDAHGAGAPFQGQGLLQAVHDLSDITMMRGRIEDIYMDACCAIVSTYGGPKALPCLWLAGAMNRWRGVKSVEPPAINSEALIWMPPDGKYGIILGLTNAPGDGNAKPAISLFNTPVDRTSPNEIHNSKDWKVDRMVVQSANGIHTDILPGDSVQVNEMGAMNALLMFLNVMQGADAAKVETFVIDQLVRITAFNYQLRTSMGELNVMNDHGLITQEESGSHHLEEAITLAPDSADAAAEGRETHLRRFHNFRGWLGGLVQSFIIRPHYQQGDLDKAQAQPDCGVLQHVQTLAGWDATRSVLGGGRHKALQIAVPKKKHEVDDPAGDATHQYPKPIVPFAWSEGPKTPASIYCQLRDFFAWHFNHNLPQRFLERSKDWTVPDESDCPAPLGIANFKTPGIGGFHREFPEETAAMDPPQSFSMPGDDFEADGFKGRPGEAWDHILPDGSISQRDAWGTGIESRGGHLVLTASKDIQIFAGGSVIIMGGDDVVIRAKQAVDISSTENQVRIRSQKEMFIHAEDGGMLISLGTAGSSYSDASGEKRTLPGICVKVPDQGGFIVSAGTAVLNLDKWFMVDKGVGGNYPQFLVHSTEQKLWMEDGGPVTWNWGGKNVRLDANGSMWLDGQVIAQEDIMIKGSIQCEGGVLAGQYLGTNGSLFGFGDEGCCNAPGRPEEPTPITTPPLDVSIGDSSTFQVPYQVSELNTVAFCYRTPADYATQDGKWFETFWQRETHGLGSWNEKSAKDGSYPYPGKDHFGSKREFWTYREGNVQSNGRPKARGGMSASGGSFSPQSWQNMPVHPDR